MFARVSSVNVCSTVSNVILCSCVMCRIFCPCVERGSCLVCLLKLAHLSSVSLSVCSYILKVKLTSDTGDQRAYRYCVILRQVRPLLLNSAFQQSLFKLVGSDEEAAVAKEKQRTLMRVMPSKRLQSSFFSEFTTTASSMFYL